MTGTIGWDVGGAHLKAALCRGGRIVRVWQAPTPIWQGLAHLETALDRILAEAPEARRHAVTMTGELADIFDSRSEGVARLARAMTARLPGETRLYAGAEGLVPASEAEALAPVIASANWHAAARLVAARAEAGLLLDMGSTTTDIVPVAGGVVRSGAASDASRLEAGELVYLGWTRTALMALGPAVPFAGRLVPVMNEQFATTADAGRVASLLDEADDLQPAADGKEKTRPASQARLARMVGRDASEASDAEWAALGRAFLERMLRRVHDACLLVLSRADLDADAGLVVAGTGRPLLARLTARLDRGVVDFSDLAPCRPELRAAVDRAAPACALALLAD